MQFLFPLRYPGGKRKLAPVIAQILRENSLRGAHYVEPFVDGASVALYLLMHQVVSSIHINDKDPALFTFWKVVCENPEALIEKIQKTPVTLRTWHTQKAIYRNKKAYCGSLDLAYATLFLNRCNRSGILMAGPIGGMQQKSRWTIDCRFPTKTIVKRIQAIACYRRGIRVSNRDAIRLLDKMDRSTHTFVYVDPPYYQKGATLYRRFFTRQHHRHLHAVLRKKAIQCLVSYDLNPFIQGLYRDWPRWIFPLTYSAHQHTKEREVLYWKGIKMRNTPYFMFT